MGYLGGVPCGDTPQGYPPEVPLRDTTGDTQGDTLSDTPGDTRGETPGDTRGPWGGPFSILARLCNATRRRETRPSENQ